MKILVVDDEPLVRRSLVRAGQVRDHQMLEANDGLEGLELWRTESPDIVLLDVLMPGLSGPEVLKEMGLGHNSKAVLMSAYSGDYDLAKAQSMGAELFIAKPFEDIFKVFDVLESL